MTAPLLQLRSSSHWDATATHLHILSHRGLQHLPLPAADTWMERLTPHLNGERSSEDIVAPLSGPERTAVLTLIRALVDSGLVREFHSGDADEPLHPETNLLDYDVPAPAATFERWSTRMVTVIGGGHVAEAVQRALRRSGVRQVNTADQPSPFNAHVVHVLNIDDRKHMGDLMTIEAACTAGGVALTQVVGDGSAWWVTEPGFPFQQVLPRVHAEAASPVYPAETDSWPVVLAGQVVHGMLTHFARSQRTSDGSREQSTPLRRFDSQTLTTTQHPYIPALALTDSSAAPGLPHRFRELRRRDPIDDDSLAAAAQRVCDDRTGVFSNIDEAALPQLPLSTAQTWITVPQGQVATRRTLIRPIHRRIRGIGASPVRARLNTAAAAIRAYLAAIHRMTVNDGGWLVGIDLATEQVVAGRWEPTDASQAAAGWTTEPGVAVGRDIDEAIANGLLDLCLVRTLAQRAHAAMTARPVDLDAIDDATARRCHQLLAATSEVSVLDITGVLGVPTVEVTLDGHVAAYGCGADLPAAISTGLLRAAARRQQVHGQHGHDDVADTCWASAPVTWLSELGKPTARSHRDDRDTLVAALTRHGVNPACVLLDHDPEVFSILPTVRIIDGNELR